MDILVVGAGLTGATLARALAEKGHEIRLIEQREHLAGNCFDYFNDNEIDVHMYGTHIFHTQSAEVWHFASRFAEWYPYQHEVRAFIDGKLVPVPFNINSIEALFPTSIADRLIYALLNEFELGQKVPILELRKSQNKDLQFLANYVYEKVFLHYTEKQWGFTPEQLDQAVTGRVPVFVGKDNRYFQDKYQGIPIAGYTRMVERMLEHENISVDLNTKFSRDQLEEVDHCFYTGAIDEYFNYVLGELPYRSLKFNFLEFNRAYFQSYAVVNYPNNYDWTRIGEYKYFLDTKSDKTVVSYEYPEAFVRGQNERYYPIPNEVNDKLYKRYLELAAKEAKLTFAGRLGDYRYYNMDQAMLRAIKLSESF